MTQIPPFAPGCFGSALAFDAEHPLCGNCIFAEGCQPLHEKNLAAIRAQHGITAKSRAKKVVGKVRQADGTMALPKKVQMLIDRFERDGLKITESLAKGENPFLVNCRFMAIVAELLLKLGRPIDQPTLTYSFTSKLGWTENTSKSHARIAIQMLTAIGAVDNIDGMITLRRPQ